MHENAKSTNTKKLDVLIVEDEMITAMLFKTILSRLNCEIMKICKTGENALEILEKQLPDVILMDIFLQGNLTGIDITKILNKKYKYDKIIYITANSDERTKKEALETDHLAYLEKPITSENLKRIFEKI